MEPDDSLGVGWYTSDDGSRKYWDGSSWLTADKPGEDLVSNGGPSRARRGRRRILISLLCSFLLLGLVGGMLVAIEYKERRFAAESESESESGAEAKSAATAEAEEQARLDREATEVAEAATRAADRAEAQAELDRLDEAFLSSNPGDWVIEEAGNVYWRYSDDSDELTCGRWDCLGVVVFAYQGCPTGLYVEAAIEADGVVIGRANDSIGAIPSEGTGAILLEDLTGYGDTFRVTRVNCR